MRINDPPDIRMAEATGYPTKVSWPVCPVCGEECETYYHDRYGDIIGCDECVTYGSAWEEMDEENIA